MTQMHNYRAFIGLKTRHCCSLPSYTHANNSARRFGAPAAAAAAAAPLLHGLRAPATTAAAASPMSADALAGGDAADPLLLASLPDAHAHPQLDLGHAPARTWALRVPAVAAMGVAAGVDWERVARLAAADGGGGSGGSGGASGTGRSCRVIPGFGIHPWWSHLHASAAGAAWPDLLEGRSAGDVAEAVGILERARESQSATNKANTDAQVAGSSSNNSSTDSGPAGAATQNQTTLDIVPHAEWRARLRALLAAHPFAIVGEVGIDRSAVIPGSRARVRPEHQWALFEEQVRLAAELQRPVSVHCVRAYGRMREFFAALPPDACPPAVMLHSYGGSPEEVGRFSGLPAIGDRFYFSFSAAINAGARSGPGDKLAARIRAVPRDRLLLESDQVTPTLVDEGMAHICALVATVRGWSKEETAQIARANFDRFFSSQYGMTEMESGG